MDQYVNHCRMRHMAMFHIFLILNVLEFYIHPELCRIQYFFPVSVITQLTFNFSQLACAIAT